MGQGRPWQGPCEQAAGNAGAQAGLLHWVQAESIGAGCRSLPAHAGCALRGDGALCATCTAHTSPCADLLGLLGTPGAGFVPPEDHWVDIITGNATRPNPPTMLAIKGEEKNVEW